MDEFRWGHAVAADHTSLHPSTQRVRAIVVTPRDGSGPPFLIVEIEVECEVCGGFEATIAGHHVLALAQALTRIAEEHRDLVGPPMDQGKVERTEWAGNAASPEKARLN